MITIKMSKVIAMLITDLVWLLMVVELVVCDGIQTESIVDLTHPLNSQTLHWPEARDFELKVVLNGTVKRGDSNIWIQSDEIYMSTHTGTHLDAPCHFARGKWSVADIPIENFIDRPVALIDVVDQSVATRDYEMSVQDVLEWEKLHGDIPDQSVILVRTGWGRFWPKKLEYFGTETKEIPLLHFPGVHPDAAQWIVDNRNIVGIGIDSPSIDHGQSKGYRSHQIFAAKNIYHLENIAPAVHKLPALGARLWLLPMKIEGASGTSVTVIARITDSAINEISIASKCSGNLWLALQLSLLASFVTLRYIIS